jgi:hypothetical protein
VRPLAQHSAGCQAIASAFEELTCEQRRDAGHPGIRRLRHDHVVLLAAEHQVGAAVTDDQPGARVLERVVILGREKLRGLDHFA